MSSVLNSAVTCQCFLQKMGPVVDLQLYFDAQFTGRMCVSTSGGRIFSCSFIKIQFIPLQQAHENEAVLKPTIHALPIKWDHCVGGIS